MVNESTTFFDLPTGAYSVALGDVAENCIVDGDNPLRASVFASREVQLDMWVGCLALAQLDDLDRRVIDFETYPDGLPSCDRCAVSDEFVSLGVVFRGEQLARECPESSVTWELRATAAYDPVGVPPNHGMTNRCSTGRWFVEFPANPAVVRLRATVGVELSFVLSARDGSGRLLSKSSISTSSGTYTSRFGFEFRTEEIEIRSLSGVSEIWFDTAFYGVTLDDIRLLVD